MTVISKREWELTANYIHLEPCACKKSEMLFGPRILLIKEKSFTVMRKNSPELR